ncbi:nuclear transport factor 2 family protein [Opitutus terrae]|uniref:SnoaL-like domain-containing protein n=1 Tax=Opitutus terrae (strain DSM 11246 / JCM 15787 / PB90-1) TaxID=452637 RepID=B1ZMY8_OPITP|nr:nuclear transport factor 2 family protein [Opitutus terrae]ACB76440.1 hypothetical protein Oter_3160 [Opitutus terrae PB90-1]
MKPFRSLLWGCSILVAAQLIATPTKADENAARAWSDPAVEQAVLATNTQMIAAANRLDVDAFFAYIVDTDKGMIVQNGTIFRTRQQAYDAVKRGMAGVTKLERRIENPQVTVIGPDTALLVADGSVDAVFVDGRSMTSRFAVSLLFVRTGTQWKLLHGHYSAPAMR